MKAKVPRLLSRPKWCWASTALLVFTCIVSWMAYGWFGATQDRLLRQSGWITYSLREASPAAREITHLAAGPDGRLWIGTDSGLHVFNGEGWESYLEVKPGWPVVYSLAVDTEGRAWVVSDLGLQMIEDGQVHLIEKRHFSLALATDQAGQVWTAGDVLHGIAPVTTQGIGESLSGTDPAVDLRRTAGWVLAFGPDDRLWVGTSGGVSVYDGVGWQDYVPAPRLSVGTIAFDPMGQVWVSGWTYAASSCCPLAVFDSQQWRQYQVPFPTHEGAEISALAFDNKGRLWVTFYQRNGQVDHGLGVYDGESWTFYQTGDAVDPLVGNVGGSSALLVDEEERLWIGVGPVLAAFDIQTGLPPTDPVPSAVLSGRRLGYWLAWGTGVLAVGTAIVAAWATILNSKWGRRWTQQLRAESATRFPGPTQRVRSWLLPVSSGLSAGICLVIWTVLCFLFWQGPTSNLTMLDGLPDLGKLVSVLICWGPICFAFGVGAGLLIYFSGQGIYRRHTPTRLVLGILGVLLSILIWVAVFLATFWVLGMLATG